MSLPAHPVGMTMAQPNWFQGQDQSFPAAAAPSVNGVGAPSSLPLPPATNGFSGQPRLGPAPRSGRHTSRWEEASRQPAHGSVATQPQPVPGPSSWGAPNPGQGAHYLEQGGLGTERWQQQQQPVSAPAQLAQASGQWQQQQQPAAAPAQLMHEMAPVGVPAALDISAALDILGKSLPLPLPAGGSAGAQLG